MRRGVLVVEDDVELLELLVEIINGLKLDVFYANDGTKGLDLWHTLQHESEVTTVLCDLNMPGMNGIELLRHVRTARSPIPFVILSGFGDSKRRRELEQLGVFAFLEKPFDENILRATITRATALGAEIREGQTKLDRLRADIGMMAPETKAVEKLLTEQIRASFQTISNSDD